MSHNELLRSEWKERVSNYKSSGLTQKEWCNQNHQSLHQLHYWLRKFRNQSESAERAWVKADLEEPILTNDSISIFIGKFEIKVSSGFNEKLLINIVRVLNLND